MKIWKNVNLLTSLRFTLTFQIYMKYTRNPKNKIKYGLFSGKELYLREVVSLVDSGLRMVVILSLAQDGNRACD
jgi:hypothetical protein